MFFTPAVGLRHTTHWVAFASGMVANTKNAQTQNPLSLFGLSCVPLWSTKNTTGRDWFKENEGTCGVNLNLAWGHPTSKDMSGSWWQATEKANRGVSHWELWGGLGNQKIPNTLHWWYMHYEYINRNHLIIYKNNSNRNKGLSGKLRVPYSGISLAPLK